MGPLRYQRLIDNFIGGLYNFLSQLFLAHHGRNQALSRRFNLPSRG
jgi:hypothetical protein